MALLSTPPISGWLGWLSFLNLSPTSTGLCLSPMSAENQIILSVMSPLILTTQLVIIGIIQWLLQICSCSKAKTQQWCWPRSSYSRTLITIYLFSFTTVATSLVAFMSCVTVQGRTVVFAQPTVCHGMPRFCCPANTLSCSHFLSASVIRYHAKQMNIRYGW
jgi:hypothetical protein